jgi:CheY-like chemotaxis protein
MRMHMGEQVAHILVVDDDPDVVEADRLVLEGAGYRVSSASNGSEALVRLRVGDVDLVILDVMMAHPTEGFHLSYKMKDDPKLRDIPVLMVTAVEQRLGERIDWVRDAEYLPVSDFVRKPVEPDELLARVKKLLEVARSR